MLPDDPDVLLLIVGVLAIFGIVIQIFFLWTLSRCLGFVQPRNRDMQPRQVWLNLIPAFNIVWIFFTINRIGSSLRKEYRSRRWPTAGLSFGVNVGLMFAVCLIIGPVFSWLAAFGGFVCFAIYWSQIVSYSSKLQSQPVPDRPFDVIEDEFDDLFDDLPPRQPPTRPGGERDERFRDGGPRRRLDDDDEPEERIRAR